MWPKPWALQGSRGELEVTPRRTWGCTCTCPWANCVLRVCALWIAGCPRPVAVRQDACNSHDRGRRPEGWNSQVLGRRTRYSAKVCEFWGAVRSRILPQFLGRAVFIPVFIPFHTSFHTPWAVFPAGPLQAPPGRAVTSQAVGHLFWAGMAFDSRGILERRGAIICRTSFHTSCHTSCHTPAFIPHFLWWAIAPPCPSHGQPDSCEQPSDFGEAAPISSEQAPESSEHSRPRELGKSRSRQSKRDFDMP